MGRRATWWFIWCHQGRWWTSQGRRRFDSGETFKRVRQGKLPRQRVDATHVGQEVQ